jgi:M6 family metalloprotease domain
MKKVLAFIMAFVLCCGFATTAGARVSKLGTGTKLALTLPDLQKADSDIPAEEAREVSERYSKIAGKAYIKPKTASPVTHLDQKGNDKKGIAILVDFPVYDTQGNTIDDQNGKISDIPGIRPVTDANVRPGSFTYERLPGSIFNDLLNGTTYNPYDLDIFNWLKYYGDGLEYDVTTGKQTYDPGLSTPIPAPTDRTLKNYFNEVSYGQFGIKVDIANNSNWLIMPHPYEYYLGQDQGYYNENGEAHIAELVTDAINAADAAGIDFSQYAVDAQPGDFDELYGDGRTEVTAYDGTTAVTTNKIVPNIFIVHRGTGAEYSRDPEIIWSHKWSILSADYFGYYDRTGEYKPEEEVKYIARDGVVLNVYNICPEVGQDMSGYRVNLIPSLKDVGYEGRVPSPPNPGVYCHEFSHVLGVPDQYDYGYDSNGTDMMSLMCGGDTGGHIDYRWYWDNSPVHLDSWSKVHLGFAQPINVDLTKGKQTLTLNPVELEPDIYKIVVPGSNGREYFLLENRQQIGYDKGLACNGDGEALHGLEVYHVVEDIYSRNPNRPNEAADMDNDHLGKSQQGVDYYTETGESHYAFSVIQADGRYDLEGAYPNYSDAGDLFPGKNNVTKLGANINDIINTSSVYKWNTKSTYTGIVIDNIAEKDGIVTCEVYLEK